MAHKRKLPPFQIIPDTQTGEERRGAGRLGTEGVAMNIALSPEDRDQIGEVAARIIERHAGDAKIVWLFFHATADLANRYDPGLIRARYVRDDIAEDPNPNELKKRGSTFEVRLPHGVITIEKPGRS